MSSRRETELPKRLFNLVILLPLGLWTACGGGSGGTSNTGGGNGGGTSGGAVNPPVVVSVSAGQAISGVNIVVPGPASSPTPNITLVGADGVHANSSGDIMHQNSSATVIVAGTGLNTSMKASFSGPADITVGPLQLITFTNNSKGISFTATVAPNAALGARTRSGALRQRH
jgi:hypothetical protein